MRPKAFESPLPPHQSGNMASNLTGRHVILVISRRTNLVAALVGDDEQALWLVKGVNWCELSILSGPRAVPSHLPMYFLLCYKVRYDTSVSLLSNGPMVSIPLCAYCFLYSVPTLLLYLVELMYSVRVTYSVQSIPPWPVSPTTNATRLHSCTSLIMCCITVGTLFHFIPFISPIPHRRSCYSSPVPASR